MPIFDMPVCGGRRTCEIACSFHHRREFNPAVSSIKILSQKGKIPQRVWSVWQEEKRTLEIPCDGCKDLEEPLCLQLKFTNFDRKNDMPTPREWDEPILTGKLAGWRIDKNKYKKMLDEYYDLHGGDRQTSYPQRKTLVELGLEKVAEDLAKIGKLR